MSDPRPVNCRHRLQDEGKAYPRSSCTACGATIATGLGRSCPRVGRPSEAQMTEPADVAGLVERRAPVQGYSAGIPWSMHLEAYDVYCKRYSPQPALIQGGCRGGFHANELDEFIPGWRERLAYTTKLEAEVKSLSSRLVAVERERDEALDRADELDGHQEQVSAEFEGECWIAMRSLLKQCNFDWSDADHGVQADEARGHISESIRDIERRAESAEARLKQAEEALRAIVVRDKQTYRSEDVATAYVQEIDGPCGSIARAALKSIGADNAG
jgi:chorismate-pyruvate lyase